MYSNCCYSCSFEPEIIKISQSSHKMYSNNILNFQESTTSLNACTKKVWKLIECTTYIYNQISYVDINSLVYEIVVGFVLWCIWLISANPISFLETVHPLYRTPRISKEHSPTLSLHFNYIHSIFHTSRYLKFSLSISAFLHLGTWTKPHVPKNVQVIFSVTLKICLI